jgi:putative ABC transport system permease protein
VRASLVAARDALRTYWATAVLIVITGAVALAATVPVMQLAQYSREPVTGLRFSTIPVSDLGFHWSTNASTPAATQAEAVGLLSQLLLLAACAALALACVTILSISAARGSARVPEIAVRRAVGAARRTLLGSALMEGGALGGITLAIGIVAGLVGVAVAVSGWSGSIDPGSRVPAVTVTCLVAIVIVLGSLFQLLTLPARRIQESSPRPLGLYIPAIQLGMGLTVLVASMLVLQHSDRLLHDRRAGTGDGVVYQMSIADTAPARRAATLEAMVHQLKSDPEIESASVLGPGGLVGLGMVDVVTTDCGYCSEGGVILKYHPVFTTHQFVTADSFEALGIERVEGRLLTPRDRQGSPLVAVISESLARRHFQSGQPLGRQIALELSGQEWYTVVGVVKDRIPPGFGGEMQPQYVVFLSALQRPPNKIDLLVRSRNTRNTDDSIQRALSSVVKGGSLPEPIAERTLVARETGPLSWFGTWFGILGWAMIVVTAMGAFVLMRLWVVSLRPELGLRRAVGARRRHLYLFILSRALLTGLAGVLIALWFGPALWDTLPSVIAGLEPWDLVSLSPLALVLVSIAMAGALVPALAAAHARPSELIESSGE